MSSPNKLAARIFRAVGCSRLRAEIFSWSDRGTGVDPTHPLALALTLTLTLTLTRTQNSPEMAEKRGCATYLWKFLHYSDLRTTTHPSANGRAQKLPSKIRAATLLGLLHATSYKPIRYGI